MVRQPRAQHAPPLSLHACETDRATGDARPGKEGLQVAGAELSAL